MDRHRTELVQHSTYRGSSHWKIGSNRVQIQKEVISDLKRENQFLSKRDMGVYMIDLKRDVCKTILKLDFSAQGYMESLSAFGLWNTVLSAMVCHYSSTMQWVA
jgi:hypothetical protein